MNRNSPERPFNEIRDLPPADVDLESVALLKPVNKANRFPAELKGYCQALPNPELLLNTVILQESKDSSEIKNIVSTQDELYKSILLPFENMPQKVQAYGINDLLFSHPYIKIKMSEENKIGSRNTVSKYLQMMEKEGIVKGMKIGKEMYYLNDPLMKILIRKNDTH